MCKALWLSQYNTAGRVQSTLKSFSKYVSHCSSQVVEASALYSASDDDRDTVLCFVVFQETRDFPMKKQ